MQLYPSEIMKHSGAVSESRDDNSLLHIIKNQTPLTQITSNGTLDIKMNLASFVENQPTLKLKPEHSKHLVTLPINVAFSSFIV